MSDKVNAPKEEMFRHQALEHQSRPDEVTVPYKPIPYQKGLIALIFFTIGILFLSWLVFGSLPIPINGRGIVMNRQGIFSIESKVNGIIKEILVAPGDTVRKGQLLITLTDPTKEKEYALAEKNFAILKANIDKLISEIETENLARKTAAQNQIASSNELITQIEQAVQDLEKQYMEKQDLFKSGFLGLRQIYQAQQLLSQRKIELESTKGAIAAYEANLIKSYLQQELLSRKEELLEAKQKIDLLQLSLNNLNITSNFDGVVLEVLGHVNEKMTAGTPVVRLEYGNGVNTPYVIYGYVTPGLAKMIQPDTTVQIELSTVRADEHGALLGTIKEISLFPISKVALGKKIQNPGLVEYLTDGDKIVAQLLIEPKRNPNSPSGYFWTSGVGPDKPLSLGTVGTIKGIATTLTPFYYLVSLWRFEKIQSELKAYFQKETEENVDTPIK